LGLWTFTGLRDIVRVQGAEKFQGCKDVLKGAGMFNGGVMLKVQGCLHPAKMFKERKDV